MKNKHEEILDNWREKSKGLSKQEYNELLRQLAPEELFQLAQSTLYDMDKEYMMDQNQHWKDNNVDKDTVNKILSDINHEMTMLWIKRNRQELYTDPNDYFTITNQMTELTKILDYIETNYYTKRK